MEFIVNIIIYQIIVKASYCNVTSFQSFQLGLSMCFSSNYLDWVPNRGACIDACLSGNVTRSFRLHDIKFFQQHIMMNENSMSIENVCSKHVRKALLDVFS